MTAQDELERLVQNNALTKSEYSRIRQTYDATMVAQAKTAVGYYVDDKGKKIQLSVAVDPNARPWLDELSGINGSFDQNQGLARYSKLVPKQTASRPKK